MDIIIISDRLFSDKQCSFNMFVRLSGFIYPTSRRVFLESSRTTSTLDHFFVFSGRRSALNSDHATVRAYGHVCRILLKQQIEVDVSGSRCLDALVDTLYVPRRAYKAIRLRHCITTSDGQKRDPC